MTDDPVTFTLALVGSVVSVGLGALRAYEFFRDRQPNLSVTTILTGSEDEGHNVTLLNASKIPASIYRFDLVWAKRGFFGKDTSLGRRFVRSEFSLGPDRCEFTVPAHGQHNLNFNEGEHFAWGPRLKDDLYLRVWTVGRRGPVWLWVTGPDL